MTDEAPQTTETPEQRAARLASYPKITIAELQAMREPNAENALACMFEIALDVRQKPCDRIAAARVALSKVIPDQRAVELTTKGGPYKHDDAELDRRIDALLAARDAARAARLAGRESETGQPKKAH